ncbi:hypothetical protein O181_091131 [Austropuccinia psidii MF-1]|uniref:Uncharacterized protein n=1 Tax=Austropuccinia psidii MF-1 TaxID=1389203 RepID=A0A9Q3IWX2_9BASI|nr:hypothetical protein [Austropuccinia psidii MF-1]
MWGHKLNVKAFSVAFTNVKDLHLFKFDLDGGNVLQGYSAIPTEMGLNKSAFVGPRGQAAKRKIDCPFSHASNENNHRRNCRSVMRNHLRRGLTRD